MPRDSNGNYSLPVGTLVSTGDTVLPSQHNPAMQDIATALTNSMTRSGGTFTGAVSFAAGISGNVTFLGNLGAAALTAGTLGVTGTATFAGGASFPAGITGPVTFGGSVGAASFSTSGSLGVGTTLTVSGDGAFGGNVTASSFTPTSDERIKTQIVALSPVDMMTALKAIGGKHYLKNGVPEIGVVAQDVQAVLPDLVGATFDGMCTVNYNGLVAALIATVVGLDARIRAMEDAA